LKDYSGIVVKPCSKTVVVVVVEVVVVIVVVVGASLCGLIFITVLFSE